MKTHRRPAARAWVKVTCLAAVGIMTAGAERASGSPAPEPPPPIEMSLDESVRLAMECNRSRPASRYAVAAAEAQHRQVMSAYWPHVSLKGAYEILDEPPNYIFPSRTFSVPPSSLNLPLPPGLLPVPGLAVTVPGQELTIPDQSVKLQDEQSFYASLEARWLLWDGGMRRGLREQARAGVDAAHENLRRTELGIVDSVTRIFHGAVMARQVREVGEVTLVRMEATLSLTETLYQEGAGRVRKTDYLSSKVMVETLRGAVALLQQNQDLAEAALAYTVGLEWNQSVRPTATQIPFEPLPANLQALVGEAYEFSPDWKRLEAGLRAREGALREAKSERHPRVALIGDLHRWWNGYDKGLATSQNKQGWTVRVGVELPLFTGFRTRYRIEEALDRLKKLKEERVLLREGLGLQVREIVLGMDAAVKRYDATLAAMNAAAENRDLNTRAYQNDLVETEDVIKSQLMEAFMSAQHYKMRYDHAELRSKLNVVVGREVARRLGAE